MRLTTDFPNSLKATVGPAEGDLDPEPVVLRDNLRDIGDESYDALRPTPLGGGVVGTPSLESALSLRSSYDHRLLGDMGGETIPVADSTAVPKDCMAGLLGASVSGAGGRVVEPRRVLLDTGDDGEEKEV